MFNVHYFAFSRKGFSGGSDGKKSVCNAGDLGLIPGLGRSLGEGNDNPLQYSCLENPMDRGAWQAIVFGVPELDTTVQQQRRATYPFHCCISKPLRRQYGT